MGEIRHINAVELFYNPSGNVTDFSFDLNLYSDGSLAQPGLDPETLVRHEDMGTTDPARVKHTVDFGMTGIRT